MEYNQNIIFGTVIFLILMYIATYCIKTHRFRNLVFWALYFVAIAPNLVNFLGLITQNGIVNGILMVFFDSAYIFYLEFIYLGALLIMGVRGWLLTRKKAQSASPISKSAVEVVKSTIQKELGPDATPSEVKTVLKTIEVSAKEQIPMNQVLQTYTKCSEQTPGNIEKQTACFLSEMEGAIAQKRKERGI
jgi:hypothetical protein